MAPLNDIGIGTKVVARRNNGQVFKARVVGVLRSGRVPSSARVQWVKMDGTDNFDLGEETIPIATIATILSEDSYTTFLEIYETAEQAVLVLSVETGNRCPAPPLATRTPCTQSPEDSWPRIGNGGLKAHEPL